MGKQKKAPSSATSASTGGAALGVGTDRLKLSFGEKPPLEPTFADLPKNVTYAELVEALQDVTISAVPVKELMYRYSDILKSCAADDVVHTFIQIQTELVVGAILELRANKHRNQRLFTMKRLATVPHMCLANGAELLGIVASLRVLGPSSPDFLVYATEFREQEWSGPLIVETVSSMHEEVDSELATEKARRISIIRQAVRGQLEIIVTNIVNLCPNEFQWLLLAPPLAMPLIARGLDSPEDFDFALQYFLALTSRHESCGITPFPQKVNRRCMAIIVDVVCAIVDQGFRQVLETEMGEHLARFGRNEFYKACLGSLFGFQMPLRNIANFPTEFLNSYSLRLVQDGPGNTKFVCCVTLHLNKTWDTFNNLLRNAREKVDGDIDMIHSAEGGPKSSSSSVANERHAPREEEVAAKNTARLDDVIQQITSEPKSEVSLHFENKTIFLNDDDFVDASSTSGQHIMKQLLSLYSLLREHENGDVSKDRPILRLVAEVLGASVEEIKPYNGNELTEFIEDYYDIAQGNGLVLRNFSVYKDVCMRK